MTPSRWERIHKLFQEALEKSPIAARHFWMPPAKTSRSYVLRWSSFLPKTNVPAGFWTSPCLLPTRSRSLPE